MQRAFAELNSAGDRVEVHFRYDAETYEAVRQIGGARFVPRDRGGPYWTVPLGLDTARRLRENLGDWLILGDAYQAWGTEAVKREQNLHALAGVDDLPIGKLKRLHKVHPEFEKWLRGYQRADVQFLAATSALNLLEQRLGKTPEIIAAIIEAGLDEGPHLVCAPKTALDTVWRYEIERWISAQYGFEKPHEVITYHGDLPTWRREELLDEFWNCIEEDWPVWFCCTPATIRDGKEPDIKWKTFTIDEYHKTGLPNASGKKEKGTKFAQAVWDMESERRYALSGTPMGGKVIKLWGALWFLYPKQFTSKWNWAKNWLNIYDNGYGQDIGTIQSGREEEFYASLAPYAIRRLRSEVLPQLPKAQWIDVWCEMTPKQKKQYNEMATKAEITIEEKSLNALGILAEYARLKQFADAYAGEILDHLVRCEMCLGEGQIPSGSAVEEFTICPKCQGIGKETKQTVVPSPESGKLPALLERLAEQGIDPDDPEGDSLAIVATQFKSVAKMVHKFLNDKKIKAELLTGDTQQDERTRMQMLFRQDGTRKPDDPRVIVMVTTAGGVAITLDLVENVHILDETWVPDDQEQLADRAVNTSRMHQIGVYVYRSKDTVEEHIRVTNIEKGQINKAVLDLRRQGFRATMQEAAKVG